MLVLEVAEREDPVGAAQEPARIPLPAVVATAATVVEVLVLRVASDVSGRGDRLHRRAGRRRVTHDGADRVEGENEGEPGEARG